MPEPGERFAISGIRRFLEVDEAPAEATYREIAELVARRPQHATLRFVAAVTFILIVIVPFMHQHFSAPWSTKLKLLTAAFFALAIYVGAEADIVGTLVMVGVFTLCAAFAVRGYSVVGKELFIHRLGWATRLDLTRIASAEYVSGATLGSVRSWGVGGVFGFVGYFRDAILGSHRAYATDPANAVVLTLGEEKVVVTPERPAEFVEAVQAAQRRA